MARLSGATLTVLLSGRHAALGGRSARERASNLHLIAKAYTRAELEQERGIGFARASEVQRWLQAQGLDFACRDRADVRDVVASTSSALGAQDLR